MSNRLMRLDAHKAQWDEAERRGPLLCLDELDVEERSRINDDFMSKVRVLSVRDLWDMWKLYVEVLHGWGIMCPHPQAWRLYSGFRTSDFPVLFEECNWYNCRLCEATVINKAER